MNVTWKQTRDLRKDRFYSLSHHHLIVLKRRLLSPLGIPLPANTKRHAISFTRRIFGSIVSVADVHKDLAACLKLKRQHIKAASIAGSPWQEGELNRDAGGCRKHLHFHSVEVAPLGDAFTSELLASNYPATSYANVVTHGNRETVEQVLSLRAGLLEEQSELMKEAVGKVCHTMKSAAKTRSAQHARHQTRLLHKCAARFEIAAEVKSCRESSGNNFSIGKPTAAVITMANSFEQIVRDTVKHDNIVYHDPLLNSIGVDSEGIFYDSKSLANAQLATWIN